MIDVIKVWHDIADKTSPDAVADDPELLAKASCNARVAGIVFSDKGVPLWHGHTKTIATEAQFRALIAKYGGCAGCGAPPLLCQAHHIRPVSQGGATDMVGSRLPGAESTCRGRMDRPGGAVPVPFN